MLIYQPSGPHGFSPTGTGSGGSGGGNAPVSVQLLTSTGGLSGTYGGLLTPVFNPVTNKAYIITHDPTNFNCEESVEYDFRQEAVPIQGYYEGREMSIHEVVVKYRELGYATFYVNITVFKKLIDSFTTVSIPVSIPVIPFANIKNAAAKKQRMSSFPDGKIHTVRLAPPSGTIIGERPQATVTSKGNAGAYSVTKLILCGNADEGPQA